MDILVYHTTNREARIDAGDLAELAEFDSEARSKLMEMLMSSDYRMIAEVEADDLKSAFRDTNSIHGPWYENPNVELSGTFTPRSSMVGDLFVTGVRENFAVFVVGPCDFIKVNA